MPKSPCHIRVGHRPHDYSHPQGWFACPGVSSERPEHRACRERTDAEEQAVQLAVSRRSRAVTVRYRESSGPWSTETVQAYVVDGKRAYVPTF